MQHTRKWDGESLLAWMIVIVLHVVALRELSRIDMFHSVRADPSTRLRVTWVEREPSPIMEAPKAYSPPAPRAPLRDPATDPASLREAGRLQPATVEPTLQPRQSLSAIFLEQGLRHAEQSARAERLPADPFASRTGGVEAPAPDTIRMKPRISPRAVVAAVGQYLFAPPGYEQDPCPQNQRNIRRLITGLEPASLQRELEYERDYCRP